ncbi:MAG: hypothetical protein ABJF67_08010 [Aurantimonas coralicida]
MTEDKIQPQKARDEFLYSVSMAARYWARLPDLSDRERCEGVAFSILNIIDGTDDGPGYDLAVSPSPDDGEEYASDDYVTGVPINDCYLHEIWKR